MIYNLVRKLFISMLAKRTDHDKALISAELDSITDTLKRREFETDIIHARLMRRFDPAMAWNEAVNRACADKKLAREHIFTGPQSMAFKVQQETVLKAVKSA